MAGRVLLFPGDFNPVHIGEVALAVYGREYLKADQVVFSLRNVDKYEAWAEQQRSALLDGCAVHYEAFVVNHQNWNAETVSGLILLVRHYIDNLHCEVILLVGADEIRKLCDDRELCSLLKLCKIAVLRRTGFDFNTEIVRLGNRLCAQMPMAEVAGLLQNFIPLDSPIHDVSSADIRARMGDGRSAAHLIPIPAQVFVAAPV